MKKIINIFLSTILIFVFTCTVFAEDEQIFNPTINIDESREGIIIVNISDESGTLEQYGPSIAIFCNFEKLKVERYENNIAIETLDYIQVDGFVGFQVFKSGEYVVTELPKDPEPPIDPQVDPVDPPYYPPFHPTPIEDKEDDNVKLEGASVEIKPEVSNTTAKAEISATAVEEALEAAAKNSDTLVLAVNTTSDVQKVELALPVDSLKTVAEKQTVDVEIQTENASLVLNSDVLSNIVGQADKNEIKFTVETKEVNDIKNLVPESDGKEIALAIDVTITAGDKTISTFGGKSLDVCIPVDDKKFEEGNTYAAYIISADGSVENTFAFIEDGKAIVAVSHFSTIVLSTEEKVIFEDIEKGQYYFDAVLWAFKTKITDGMDATHFAPDKTTTRGQMVTFLWRAAGCPASSLKACPFTDVKQGTYYYDAVLWAYENGITDGTSDTTFSPDNNVTRGQAVTFLARFNGVKDYATGYSHNFTDVKAEAYYNNAVAWAFENGITDGTSATTFSPDRDCLRCQIVTYLYRNFVKAN